MHLSRSYTVASIIAALLAVVCSRIPLFNYLGFEFSAVTAIVAGFIAGVLCVGEFAREEADESREYGKRVFRVMWHALTISTIPGLLMMANAFFIKNCSLTDGVQFFILLVYPSVVFSVSLAAFLTAILRRWQKTVYALVFVLLLAHIPIVTLIGPQIFAFNPIVGYFPGITYDESLVVADRLAVFRMLTIAASILLISIGGLLRERTLTGRFAAFGAHWIVVVLIAPALVVAYVMSDRLGLSSSEAFIRERLGGRFETPQFDVVYPANSFTRDQAEQIVDAQQFAVERMRRDMDLPPLPRMTIFIYGSAEQKGRLTGAARTAFAKPWLRQVHVSVSDAPMVLTHELAHVVAAEFGTSPLKIGMNPGVIEGFAVAMERRAYQEPLPMAAALALSAGVNVRMERMFSIPGFLTSSPSVAYTLAGAFCRHLIDRYGSARFRSFYASGNIDEAYGKPIDTLVSEWRSTVDTIRIDRGMARKAEYLFRRPSIFAKECVRVIAQINLETGRLLDANRMEEARVSADRSLSLSKNTEAIFQKARAMYALGKYEELITMSRAALSDSAIANGVFPLRLRLGDAYWSLGKVDSAAQEYRTIRESHFSSSYDELSSARLTALRSGSDQSILWNLLTREMPDTVRRELFSRSSHPIVRLMQGQDLLGQKRYSETIECLSAVGLFTERELECNRLRRIGRAWFERGEMIQAKSSFQASMKFARPGEQLEIIDWIGRCDAMLGVPVAAK